MEAIRKSYTLDLEGCDAIAEEIIRFCEKVGTERRDISRYRLYAEECLLMWMNRGMENETVELRMGRYMLTPFISIEVKGPKCNPGMLDEEDFGSSPANLFARLGLRPLYSYFLGKNGIRFTVKKKAPGQIVKLCTIITAALLTGFLGRSLLAEDVLSSILSALLEPLTNVFFSLLGCVAGPMIFLSVAWGIYGIGDAETFGRIGKKMLLRYIGAVMIATTCSALFFPLLGPGFSSGSGGESKFSYILELLFGIIPSNIVEPFATGNTLQIIFMAVAIGIALLYLGRQTVGVAAAIEQGNNLVQFLMGLITRLVPYVIFMIIVNLIWSDNLGSIMSVWKLIVVSALAFVLAAAAFIGYTSFRVNMNPLLLLKKSMPTFVVALTTASSAASFSTNVETCEKQFGINPSLIRFGIPLGMVMHRPITSIFYLLIVFFFADQFGVSYSIGWICVAIFVSAVIAISTPPVPGGAAAAYAILFLQMGIPKDALAIALAVDILMDFLITAFEMLVLPTSLIRIAAKLRMIDLETLRADNA